MVAKKGALPPTRPSWGWELGEKGGINRGRQAQQITTGILVLAGVVVSLEQGVRFDEVVIAPVFTPLDVPSRERQIAALLYVAGAVTPGINRDA